MALKLKQQNRSGAGPAPVVDTTTIVKGVIDEIRAKGDEAVRAYSEKFDKWSPASFKLSQEDIKRIISTVPQQVLDDIKQVQDNVRTFALAQKASIKEFEMEIRPGVYLGQKNIPINSVGA
jgi:histidinol dehydrogenase